MKVVDYVLGRFSKDEMSEIEKIYSKSINCIEDFSKMSFVDLMNKYNIKKCFYGHLHGYSHEERIEGLVNGIELKLISSDFIKFDPVKII